MFLVLLIAGFLCLPASTQALDLHGERSVQGAMLFSGTIQPTTVAEISVEEDDGETVIVSAKTIDAMHTPWVRHDAASYRVLKGSQFTVALQNGLHAWSAGQALAMLE